MNASISKVLSVFIGIYLWIFLLPSTHAAERPNIAFILADDLGVADLGCYGCKDIRTPNLDGLARQGVRFTQFYANGPDCTPTRTGFLTGRYQHRVGGLECALGVGNVGRYDDAIRLQKQHELGLPPEESVLPRALQAVGYATAICGKWHLGYEDKFAPNRHGFDHAFYCLGGGMDYFHHVEAQNPTETVLRLDGRPIRRPGYFTDLVAEDAVEWLAANRDKPFFLYVPFTAPHAPFQGPNDRRPDPLPADSPLWNQGQAPPAVYAAMVERLDQAVGKILAELDRLKLAGNTLVVFSSDNGGTASARPTGLRGQKGTTFEGGIRVPCIARWPGKLSENTDSAQVGITMDLTASFLRAAAAKPPQDRPLDGIDVLDLVEQQRPLLERTLFWRGRRAERTVWGVRAGSLKYVARQDGSDRAEYLFDLNADPAEKTSLLSTRAEDAAHLKKLLANWEQAVRPRR